jgi:hypothetical protein
MLVLAQKQTGRKSIVHKKGLILILQYPVYPNSKEVKK